MDQNSLRKLPIFTILHYNEATSLLIGSNTVMCIRDFLQSRHVWFETLLHCPAPSATKRAKIIHADAEYQASAKLAQAAAVIAKEPVAITLRYLQTLVEIGTEKNTTVVFPLPMELLNILLSKSHELAAPSGATK